jgi:DAK2 domain fusion protein YloV
LETGMTHPDPAPPAAPGDHPLPDVRICNGPRLKLLTEAALAWLDTNHQAVNALNVFPVPDGDTGTNMLLTMQAAYHEVAALPDPSAGAVAHAVAHGALMGARGNSGVILSQIWRGFARGIGHVEQFDARLLARALREAADTAYRGVVRPVEGTILTVIKDVAAAAEHVHVHDPRGQNLRYLLKEIVAAANASVERTPELLPVLKKAGVVDSGGKGLAVLLEGMWRFASGLPLDAAAEAAPVVPLSLEAVGSAMDAVEPGQEWEVVLDFRPDGTLHLPTFYERLEAIGTSIQVGEGEGLYRVHVHLPTARRHAPLELAEEFGTLVQVHMENLLDQLAQADTAAAGRDAAETAGVSLAAVEPGQIGVVAVSPGLGFSRLMGSLGAAAIVSGGQTMNPATQDLLAAIEQLGTDRVIVLPNNKNIILAAEQAASLTTKQVCVVPTRSVPQGIAALLNLVPDGDLASVAEAMQRAVSSVHTGEVTTASRSVEIDGVSVTEGQIIGLHNGALVAAGASVPAVVQQVLDAMDVASLELVTLYPGAEVPPDVAEQMAEQVRQAHPHLSVEVHAGGQPHYWYILSAE